MLAGAEDSGLVLTMEPACVRPRRCMADAEHSPLLVYHPQGGLSNSLFGLSSAALLATAQCRRFAVAWGHNANRQASASFTALFQRPLGLEFLNESEGHDEIVAMSSQSLPSDCTVQLNQHWDRTMPISNLLMNYSMHERQVHQGPRCPVLHVRGNMYYAPLLERNARVAVAGRWLRARGLDCDNAAHLSAVRGGSAPEPFFAAVSRHLFVPHKNASARADNASVRSPTEAIIGVHVRSTILLALHKERHNAACGSTIECGNLMEAYGFLDCIAKVRNASVVAGYATSRVYLAADNAMVRKEALKALGESNLVPTPSYLFPSRESRKKMAAIRGALATLGAVDEMLLLARTDGLVVWDLADSTYSAAAASWAAHRAGRQPAHASGRTWLGVHVASRSCAQLPDAEVDPAIVNGLH